LPEQNRIREIKRRLSAVLLDVECLIDHGCTVAEMERVNAERAGQKWARFL